MHNHYHTHCTHIDIKYCSVCNLAYCISCGVEFTQKYNWTYTGIGTAVAGGGGCYPTYPTFTNGNILDDGHTIHTHGAK